MTDICYFDKYIKDKIAKSYDMLVLIKRSFTNMFRDCFLLLYKSMVKSYLEYANSEWWDADMVICLGRGPADTIATYYLLPQ